MIKVLVTVGTYRFDDLIKKIDHITSDNNLKFTCQIGNGHYEPKNCCFFRFTNSFNRVVDESDLIITHAGAGTVYSLLEKGKNIIVIPNLERVDKHQLEIAKFVCDNKYGLACFDVSNLEASIDKVRSFIDTEKKGYRKDDFFKKNEILEFLGFE